MRRCISAGCGWCLRRWSAKPPSEDDRFHRRERGGAGFPAAKRRLRSADDPQRQDSRRADEQLLRRPRWHDFHRPRGILPGVTRRYVLRLARTNGIGIAYRPPRTDEVALWDEGLPDLSSGRGVVPVTNVAGQPVGTGQPGPIARLLRRAYDEYVLKKAERV